MELRQLEYFIVVCQQGSFNQAADCLYTSQPNVSKIIGTLERELGHKLFERTSKGVRITPYGETVREYAQNILKNVSLINSMANYNQGKKFTLSAYPSNMIARLLTDFYKEWGDAYIIEHQEGTVEEISNNVSQGMSEIGIVYVARKHLQSFHHILSHRNLKFEELDIKEACVYVGPNHPLYSEDSIDFADLSKLRFVRGVRDFFSMEHHLAQISLGAVSIEKLNYAMYTNSNHLHIDLLLHTDICSLGINFLSSQHEQYNIKTLRMNNCEPFLVIGYVHSKEGTISEAADWFVTNFRAML